MSVPKNLISLARALLRPDYLYSALQGLKKLASKTRPFNPDSNVNRELHYAGYTSPLHFP